MKKCSLVVIPVALIIILLITGASCRRHYSRYRFPGEFEKQQALWLLWPSDIYNFNDRPVNPVLVRIIEAVAPVEKVGLIVSNSAQIGAIKNLLKNANLTSANLHYYIVKHLSIWARDVGPIFVKDNRNRLHVVNFGFNNYSRGGDLNYIRDEGEIDERVAGKLKLPVINSKLISEGGAIESNGKGSLMVTESVVLKRNPAMTKQQIEKEYRRVLGVRKIIWLKKGLAEDDWITSGHINEIARFVNPHTILLAEVLPGDRYTNRNSRDSFLRLEENYRILKSSTDQDGKPFLIKRIPMPPTLYGRSELPGNVPLRSYLNFAITNKAVLMQSYWKPGRSQTLKTAEKRVRKILRKSFPGHRIIGIDAENVNLWGGGIHCITQHMPATQ